ncbi:MAG: hypothetical protein ILP09_04180, partial [Oscillospiraceae bacterium]|nr:hypothetical protein [Oscillospiraceae bacterium]
MKHGKLLTLLAALTLVLSISSAAFAADAEVGEEILTRGEFVEALYKLSGEWDVEPKQDHFDDVPAEGGLA